MNPASAIATAQASGTGDEGSRVVNVRADFLANRVLEHLGVTDKTSDAFGGGQDSRARTQPGEL